MKQTPDVLIVGAGIIGTSIADRLTSQGVGEVMILEKEPMPATGSTGRSAGGIRQQFGDEAKIRAAFFGYPVFDTFQAAYGVDPGFKRHGYLILRSKDSGAHQLKADVELQRTVGLETRYLEPDEVPDMIPALFSKDLKGASFNGSDGYLDPHALVQGFLAAFRKQGGRIAFEKKAESLLLHKGRVQGVMTSEGKIHAGSTILAAGPQIKSLLEPVGVRFPIRTCRRQIFSTGPVKGVPTDWPLILDVDVPFYFRPEGEGVIMSLAEVEEMEPPEEGNEIPLSRQNFPELATRASHRCPLLSEAEIRSGWAGLRTITPDERPILGPVPGMENLFVAAGFSGHGITLAPFTAEYLLREVTGQPLDHSLRAPFLASRLL